MWQDPKGKSSSFTDLLVSAMLLLILLACITLLSAAPSQSVVARPAGATSGVGMQEAGLAGSASTGPFSGPTPACTPVWSVVDSPNPGVYDNDLIAVAARASDDVWAVGAYQNPDVSMTLVEHWDGAVWTVIPSPNVGSTNVLRGVVALASDDAWAVGFYSSGGPEHTLVEHWDGGRWSVIPSPNMGTFNELLSVAAVAQDDIWAVGYYADPSVNDMTLTEHWDGNQWSVVPSPNLGRNNLWGVAAVASDDVWAVGWRWDGIFQTLTMHWGGINWNVVPSPNVDDSLLYAVAATSSDDVWAMGKGADSPLTLHWNGTGWTVFPSAKIDGSGYLYGAAARSANDAWSVGYYVQRTLVPALLAHWDGATWSLADYPTLYLNNYLRGVSALSATNVWAVGDYIRGCCVSRTLIYHLTDPCATPSPTPTRTPLTPLPTFTGTPPTATATPSRTATPTATPTLCAGGHYQIAQATGTIVPGTSDIGNHCDDCATAITLPFAYRLYDQTFYRVHASSNGALQFVPQYLDYYNICLPVSEINFGILPYWDDLRTDEPGSGIFTSVTGVAPNRIFNIEWRATYFSGAGRASFEARLYEGQSKFDLVYPRVDGDGDGATIGVQRDSLTGQYTQYECNSAGISPGLLLSFSLPCGTPTPTLTGTPPTSTPTRTPTTTPTSCVSSDNYTITQTMGTLVPGTKLFSGCGFCVVTMTLPFDFYLYGQPFSSALVGTNGTLGFISNSNPRLNVCLPSIAFDYAILPYWDYLRYMPDPPYCSACGVYTSVTGRRPDRILNIEWRACVGFPCDGTVDFEVRLYENSPTQRFDIVYGQVYNSGSSATVGVQWRVGGLSTEYECNTGGLSEGMQLTFTQPPCGYISPTPGPATPTGTATPTSPPTNSPTNTPTATATSTRTAAVTDTPTYTPTVCAILFRDVRPSDYFYEPVRYLYCHGVISGYADGTFRPYYDSTRGQLTKIVVLGFGMPIYTPPTPTFNDVPTTQTFYQYVETAHHSNLVSGYNCGGPGEPCPGLYFRPGNSVTRGQLCKIVALAAGWPLLDPSSATFRDVPVGSPFFRYVETAYAHGIVSGYNCGGPGEPCPGLYFRAGNSATRGQIAKIVYQALTTP